MAHKVENDEEKRPPNDNRQRRPSESVNRVEPPIRKEPGFWENLKDYNMSKTATIGSCLASAVLTMIIGFWWGGWVTDATAKKMVTDGAKTAIVNRLADVCVAQFNLDPAKDQKLVEMKALSSYQRGDYAETQGWLTLPGDAEPNSQAASQCVKLLLATTQ